MMQSVFLEWEFFTLVLLSLVMPAGIYGLLLKSSSISRLSVLIFAMLLIVLSGIDVFLLMTLRDMAVTTPSVLDDRIFNGELSMALYLLPAVFAGIGVNLISHVLINHLNVAERSYNQEQQGARLTTASSAAGITDGLF